MACNAFFSAGKTELFGRRRFYGYALTLDAAGDGEVVTHTVGMRGNFGSLKDKGDVDVHHGKTVFLQGFNGPAKELKAVGVFVLRVGVGIEFSDVAEGSGAEKRIADGVTEHVGVGVTEQPALMSDLYASQNQTPSFGEGMNVKTVSYPQFRH